MSRTSFVTLNDLATQLRNDLELKKYILLYAYNGTGKTRLSTAFKNIGKSGDARDTLYFNAFTEDLFSWDNDLEDDTDRKLIINSASRFFAGLAEMEMDTRIRHFLNRFADFDFVIDTTNWEIRFSRRVSVDTTTTTVENIKVSRGEESIFIWCFFLAIAQLAMDGAEAYKWVKYIYIDDPISSLDEHNAIAVANNLTRMLIASNSPILTVISTHHPLFFNVICNEFGNKAKKYFLTSDKASSTYFLDGIDGKEFLHHLSTLAELNELQQSGTLYTHHFNMLRRIMEQTANFFGMKSWKDCIRPESDDPDKLLYERILNVMSHGDYSIFEPREMMEENKELFRRIFHQFIKIHPFNADQFLNQQK